MELIVNTLDTDPLPEFRIELKDNKSSGLLNSNYQRIVRWNFRNLNSHSMFSIKQRIKSGRFHSTSAIETAIKVSVFLVVLVITFAK